MTNPHHRSDQAIHPLDGARLAAIFDGETPVEDLRRYYDANPKPEFTGRWFEHLASGGDHPQVADRVEPRT